ncbi:MAG: hypothetical protein IPJ31_00450 [Bacteroidetes bacterium]|nr:hypothetical protein [Bacteroidota bacterium]
MKTPLSRLSLCICYCTVLAVAFFYYPRWNCSNTEATLSWDVSGYYMYLPAIFIYKDINKCRFKDSILDRYHPTPDFQQAFTHSKSGNYIMKYSIGQAVVMAPFFFMGHTYAHLSGTFPADGFSYPYQLAIGVGMLLFAFMGLYYLRRILLLYNRDGTVATILLLFTIGTNYLNYAAIDQAMTHSVLFFIYTLLIYHSIQFYKSPSRRATILIGFLVGFATLIRPVEIISVIIPLFWSIHSATDLKLRMAFLKKNAYLYLSTAGVAAILIFIQLLYWKVVSNEWMVFSYQDQGFYWTRPHIFSFLFDYSSGWFLYCPMMMLPFIGFYVYLKNGSNILAVVLFTSLNFYLVTAWDIWDYGGFSGRAMIQSYPILAFPFAALIDKIHHKKNHVDIVIIFDSTFCICQYLVDT